MNRPQSQMILRFCRFQSGETFLLPKRHLTPSSGADMTFLFRCGRLSHQRMNGRRFRSFKRCDGAIELVAFRDEKGDDIVSGHPSDGNKTLPEIAIGGGPIYGPEIQNALRMEPRRPISSSCQIYRRFLRIRLAKSTGR